MRDRLAKKARKITNKISKISLALTGSKKEGYGQYNNAGAVIRPLPARQGLRLIEYKSDAMMGAHIVPHSKLLVDFSREPQNGDVVLVQRGNRFTVRFFKCSEHKRWLISANRQYADMLYDDDIGTKLSVVVKVVTDTTLLRDYMI